MSDIQQRKVMHLFERIHEPMYVPKSYGKVQYNLPDHFLPEEQQGKIPAFLERSLNDSMTFNINPSIQLPERVKVVKTVPRGRHFSLFIPSHRRAGYTLVDIFMGVKSFDELVSLAAVIRDQVNEDLFVFAWAAALIRRSDTRSLRVPPVWEIFPDKFIEIPVLLGAQAQAHLHQKSDSTEINAITVDRSFSATDRIVENRLAYFREDLGINSHHWHWHLVYPVEGTYRDRRGELFYYMHNQMLARYDAERMANGLARVVPFHNWNEPIAEAYFPKLTAANAGLHWGSRPSGMLLKDINIPDDGDLLGWEIQINDLERWTTRILHAIHQGAVIRDRSGESVTLDEERGIDILGNMIEASEWSINRSLYGDLHNFGHLAICFIHDPDGGHMENMGVMGDTSTAMRDPIFYRWHKFIDNLFQQFKATLPPYHQAQLTLPGIRLTEVEIINKTKLKPRNILFTGWQESLVELSRGLDFSSTVPVQARIKHLQHEDFNYQIKVDNTSGFVQELVFRIYMAPVKDQTGRNFTLREQRQLMIEMDKFVKKVPPGSSVVARQSTESSVTIPFEKTFRQLERAQPVTAGPGFVPVTLPMDAQTNYCGCGWPHHFLVPRGTEGSGMAFVLFVMATNWKEDRVEAVTRLKSCWDAASYCGVLNEKYPDKKPMGYPFDRPTDRNVTQLSQFLTPNMVTANIRIQFEDDVIRHFR